MTATGLLMASGATRFLLLSASLTAASPQTVAAATVAASAHNATVALWTAFVSAALALITSAFGGWTGAHHVHRVYHLRIYKAHRVR